MEWNFKGMELGGCEQKRILVDIDL